MSTVPTDLLHTLRQPEYTGENRCLPCTAVNLVIAIVVATGLAHVVPLAWPGAATLGAGAFALLAAIIYLRGYLVPGTPRLTKTYLPEPILRRFDHHPASRTAWSEVGKSIDVERTLERAGIVRECEETPDLCLDEDFRDTWTDRIRTLREEETTREDVASFLTIEPDALSFEDHDEAFVANMDGMHLAQWESHAAFLADMAAAPKVRSRLRDWEKIGIHGQSSLVYGLRIFLDRCPSCDGSVMGGEQRVSSCCRSFDVIATQCEDCGARLFEAELPDEIS